MQRISPQTLHQALLDDSVLLLDVRTDDELELAALHQAVHIPLHQLPSRHMELPRSKPVAVLCHHGVRSLTGAMLLEKQGFQDVMSVDGGIDAYALLVDNNIPQY